MSDTHAWRNGATLSDGSMMIVSFDDSDEPSAWMQAENPMEIEP